MAPMSAADPETAVNFTVVLFRWRVGNALPFWLEPAKAVLKLKAILHQPVTIRLPERVIGFPPCQSCQGGT
jgi:hypothetical protein